MSTRDSGPPYAPGEGGREIGPDIPEMIGEGYSAFFGQGIAGLEDWWQNSATQMPPGVVSDQPTPEMGDAYLDRLLQDQIRQDEISRAIAADSARQTALANRLVADAHELPPVDAWFRDAFAKAVGFLTPPPSSPMSEESMEAIYASSLSATPLSAGLSTFGMMGTNEARQVADQQRDIGNAIEQAQNEIWRDEQWDIYGQMDTRRRQRDRLQEQVRLAASVTIGTDYQRLTTYDLAMMGQAKQQRDMSAQMAMVSQPGSGVFGSVQPTTQPTVSQYASMYDYEADKQLAQAQAGLQAGAVVVRNQRTGKIQYFNPLTNRFLDPDEKRDFLGASMGIDASYVVDQRTGILSSRKELTAGDGALSPSVSSRVSGSPYWQGEVERYRTEQTSPGVLATFEQLTSYAEQTPSRQQLYTGAHYYEGDQWSYFAGAPAAEKLAVQERLVATGYLNPNDVKPGVWDYTSAKAAERMMTDANGNGLTWPEWMAEVEASGWQPPSSGGGRRSVTQISPFVAPEYIRPDYATLKQAVRRSFEGILGREVQGYELKMFSDILDGDYRQQYEAEVLAARREYDRQVAAIRSGAQYAAEAGTVQGVSPLDRLNERMLEKYSAEIDRREDISERAANGQLAMQAIGMLTSQVRSST